MKFKVTKKDFMLFCLYCSILLYFCALAVTNFTNFSEYGNFSHFTIFPFAAFFGSQLPLTLALFVGSLVMIFSSLSSSIFNKEKGMGIGIHFGDKPSDGYAKWSSEKDIKNDSGVAKVTPKSDNLEAAGIPLINNGSEIWVDNGEYHNLIIGATGSGKSVCLVKPMVNILAKKGESMIISDPKGEIYEYCADYLKKQGYDVIVLNFRDPQNGNAWNPMNLPYQYYKEGNVDKATELLEDVASNIICSKDSKDPFWENSSADYFSGLALGLFQDAKQNEVNLNSINYMSIMGEERRGTSTYIKEYFGLKGEDSSAYTFASNTINAPNETKGGILSTFRQKIRLFASREALSEMLSHSDFDMREIGNKKTAIFMIIHDEKKTYHSLMTIFVKQCYETLIDSAQKNGGKLAYRTNFILDEFANMPALKDVDSMVTAARSRDIRFTFIIQNFAQLNDVYGEETAQVIKGNCGNLIYLISTELKALEEISKMCGEVKSKEKDKTASTPLITVSDLQKLKLFQAIIIRWRKSPFKTQLTPDFKIDWGIERTKAKLPLREKQNVEVFDIKSFVSEAKKSETLNNPGSPFTGGFNPFMNASNSNPFMGAPSPFDEMPSSNPYSGLSNKDIDDMVKDIEKKLAALDEEEKQSELNKQEEFKPENDKKEPEQLSIPIVETPLINASDDKINDLEKAMQRISENENNISKKDDLELTQEIKLEDLIVPKINIDKESKVINENVVSDDDYFDDFFDE